jgi:thiamine-phosphate pyrophosphorylase
MKDFGLYIVITNPSLPYTDFVRTCVQEGVSMVQLREKHIPDGELLLLAQQLKEITSGSATKFFLNDRPDLAHLSNADGLHLGPEDITMIDAARIFPQEKLYGYSTHSFEDAEEQISLLKLDTSNLKPDYLSFGPIYATPTKEKADIPVGTAFLQRLVSESPVPIVAIGGIFPQNLEAVLKAGARNVAMVRYFMEAQTTLELASRILKIKSMIKEFTT